MHTLGRRLATALALAAAGCASLPPTGPPIADPQSVARGAATAGTADPATLRFQWRYGGRRGQVEGDGVARFNPPDSLRLDLFTSGDVALAVSLAGDSLTTLGEIEEVDLPSPSFLYAMAGLFRPAAPQPARGYRSGEDDVLVYAGERGDSTHFFLLGGHRLRRVEARRAGRLERRLVLEWDIGQTWPQRAEYRDLVDRSRVRWDLEAARAGPRHPREIYELGSAR